MSYLPNDCWWFGGLGAVGRAGTGAADRQHTWLL